MIVEFQEFPRRSEQCPRRVLLDPGNARGRLEQVRTAQVAAADEVAGQRTHRTLGASSEVGHQIGEALARIGRDWANIRFQTIPSLAVQAAGPLLAARGFRSLSDAGARVLIHRILFNLRRDGLLRYYGGLKRVLLKRIMPRETNLV